MLLRFTLLLLISLLSWGPAQALDLGLDEELSFGMAAPSPTGITVKKWRDADNAFDMFYEWSSKHRRVLVHVDLLTHDFQSLEMESGFAPVYYGFGIRAKSQRGQASAYGFRLPIGVALMLETRPLEFFGEVAPRADIIPSTNFAVDVQLGIRYRLIP